MTISTRTLAQEGLGLSGNYEGSEGYHDGIGQRALGLGDI